MKIQNKIALLALAVLMVLTGTIYITQVSGKKNEEDLYIVGLKHRGTPDPEFSSLKNPMPPTEKSIKRGREIYMENCYRCHGIYGKGDGPDTRPLPLRPRDLTDKERMRQYTDGELFYWITYGRGNQNVMSLFIGNLNKNQRWDTVNYLRTIS